MSEETVIGGATESGEMEVVEATPDEPEVAGTAELEDGNRVTVDETTPEVQERIAAGESVETAIGGVVMDIEQGDIKK